MWKANFNRNKRMNTVPIHFITHRFRHHWLTCIQAGTPSTIHSYNTNHNDHVQDMQHRSVIAPCTDPLLNFPVLFNPPCSFSSKAPVKTTMIYTTFLACKQNKQNVFIDILSSANEQNEQHTWNIIENFHIYTCISQNKREKMWTLNCIRLLLLMNDYVKRKLFVRT